MTRKRYLAVAGLLAILILAGFGVGMLMPPAPGVTKANFDCIEKGMTTDQVETILGNEFHSTVAYGWLESYPVNSWHRKDGACIEIHFTDGVAVRKYWKDPTESILEKFRRWLCL